LFHVEHIFSVNGSSRAITEKNVDFFAFFRKKQNQQKKKSLDMAILARARQ